MMPVLVAAVVLVGLLCAVDLLLTFAVLRRLREHGEKLGRLPDVVDDDFLGFDRDRLLGAKLPEFSTETVQGAVVSRESVSGSVELMGFFRPGCSPCHEQAPHFIAEARAIGEGKALALVAASGSDADEMVQTFEAVADVVLDPTSREVLRGLEISAFPTFLRLDADGVIVDAAVSMEELRSPVK
jgi:thiol-disulfide isomerase/thioredoxin